MRGRKVIVLITKQAASGGRPLKHFDLRRDYDTDELGYKIGYCASCNETLIISMRDSATFAKMFGEKIGKYYELLYRLEKKDLAPQTPFKYKIAKWLVKNAEQELDLTNH